MSLLNLLQGLTAPKNDLGRVEAQTDGPTSSHTGTKKNEQPPTAATAMITSMAATIRISLSAVPGTTP